MYALLVLISSAVAATPNAPGDYKVTLRVDGVRRDYLLHLPPCYDGCTPLPVILAFHGMSANAKRMQKWVKLDETADRYGYVTVYPDGTGLGLLKGFKAGASTQKREDRKPDDVLFVHAILDDLEQTVCMDCRRVYATGLSNGAMMCYRLAVEMPNRIAAIAPVSGALGTDVCPPQCAMPVMHFHGTCDNILPLNGPRDSLLFPQSYYPVPTTVQFFANAAHCDGAPEVEALPDTEDDGTNVLIHSYTNCDPAIEVILVEIQGGGHQWPMQPLPFRYLGQTTFEIDANEMMCCFFQRHMLAECCCCCECPERVSCCREAVIVEPDVTDEKESNDG
jgi:polyhydroxybutyrate depolymerase